MSPILRKVAIAAAVVVLLIVAYFLSTAQAHRNYVDTTGKLLLLTNGDPKTDPDAKSHIWLVSADGTSKTALTKGAETNYDPSFSPDGSMVTFISDRTGTPQVWIMNSDGSQPEALTMGSESKSKPRFSPDGKEIGYISRGTLTVVELQSRNNHLLLPIPHESSGSEDTSAQKRDPVVDFAWSPVSGKDGMAIAAVQEGDDGGQHLTLVKGEETPPVDVAKGTAISPAWSPDGTRMYVTIIGATGVRPPANVIDRLPPGRTLLPLPPQSPPSAIFTFGSDGSIDSQLPLMAASKSETGGAQHPSVSADGSLIAFEVWPSINTDISKITLISSVTASTGAPGPLQLKGPLARLRFSVDGDQIAFTAPVKGKPGIRDLITLKSGSQNLVNITKGEMNALQYEWSPAKPKTK
ncbi:MAG TPA: hypothetical protein VGK19_09730 [Capsulimonadaceae bacterium]